MTPSRLRTLLPLLFSAALLAAAVMVVAPGRALRAQSQGGAFVPTADYAVTGRWVMSGGYALSGTGTIANGATITTPAIAGYTMTGTGTIANGATITTPVLSGTVTGTYTLGGTPTITAPTITGAALSSGNFLGAPALNSSASLGGSPVTLTAAQCGQAFAMDVATGAVYLLPATFPTAGCTYDFYVTTSVTSNSHEIETNNAAHFFSGAPFMIAAAATLATGQCNGTTHIAYKTNGSTTGGLIGTHIKVIVLSATVALLDGVNAGSGSLATACSTTN